MTSSAEPYAAALSVVVWRLSFLSPALGLSEETLYLIILDRTDEIVELLSLCRSGCDSGYLMFLGKKNRKRKTDITDTCYCDFHIRTPSRQSPTPEP